MTNFREQAEKNLRSMYISMFGTHKIESPDLLILKATIDALDSLHKKEVKRIIGEDEADDAHGWGEHANIIRSEQRRRAGLEGEK